MAVGCCIVVVVVVVVVGDGGGGVGGGADLVLLLFISVKAVHGFMAGGCCGLDDTSCRQPLLLVLPSGCW